MGGAYGDSALPPTTTPGQEELASILTDVMAAVSSEQRMPVLLLGLGAAAEIAWMPYAQGDPNITAAVMINAPLPAATLFLGPRETSVLCLYGERASLAMSSFEPTHLGLQDAHILHEMLVFGEADETMLNPDSDTYQAATASEIIETSVAWFTTYGGSSHDH